MARLFLFVCVCVWLTWLELSTFLRFPKRNPPNTLTRPFPSFKAKLHQSRKKDVGRASRYVKAPSRCRTSLSSPSTTPSISFSASTPGASLSRKITAAMSDFDYFFLRNPPSSRVVITGNRNVVGSHAFHRTISGGGAESQPRRYFSCRGHRAILRFS